MTPGESAGVKNSGTVYFSRSVSLILISLSEDLIVIKRHPVMIIEDLNDASLVLEKLIYYSTGKETQGIILLANRRPSVILCRA